ncbi:MAG: hypothetical protein HYT80_00710 [Euryarchaeota archaeon]|nr:hypothetical protein [Euryarchaeota archaeon]
MNAGWLMYEHPPTTAFNYWPLVLLNVVAFLFSLSAFFKIAVRRAPAATVEPPAATPAPADPSSPEEKVG